MSERKEGSGGESESRNETEGRDTSTSWNPAGATVASDTGPHNAEGSELVSGTSWHKTWSETQSVQEPAEPTNTTSNNGPPTASEGGARKNIPLPRQMPSTQTRDTPMKVEVQPTANGQGDAHPLREIVDIPQPSGLLSSQRDPKSRPSIQEQVDKNKEKKGICVLCACTNAHCAQEHIEPSDAVERMHKCFEDKLGYLVIQVGTTITSQHLNEVLQELSKVQLPPSYCRFFFYYFGHGTEDSLCLADKNVERKTVINRLQSMCLSHPVELFKIFLFDSCRTVSPVTTHPVQVHNRSTARELGGGGGGQTWLTKRVYPSSSNTLVINATDFNCKAYYIDDAQIHGCGLVTLYFTELAPVMNASLSDVLTEVRKKVDIYIQTHPDDVQRCTGHQYAPQVLVYEDRLMGCVNLLAESIGSARVAPEKVTTNAQALNANVQWRFSSNVENRIKNFIVKVTQDGGAGEGCMPVPVSAAPNERFATLSSLKPSTMYHVKVVAIYEDAIQAKSEDYTFITSVRSSPQSIKFTQQYSGSSEAMVEWSFPGDAADLSCYKVKVEMEREESVNSIILDVQEKKAKLKSLPLSPKYRVTVTAVYKDRIEKESSAEFFSGYVQRNCGFCTHILLPLLFCLLLIFLYVPYPCFLQGSGDCQANYILSIDTIQCGYGNSLQYGGAEIKGCPVSGDVMTETLNVWQIGYDELKLYSQTLLPVNSNGKTTEHSTFLLLGWQIYTWKNSIIAGFCCIANDNEEEKTASLHMFRHDEDAYRFERGEGVRNAILSEQISVPPKKTSCFRKWGTNSPFTVTHSSYHYIGIDLPANMNYTANVTVIQAYVNISDYPNAQPKQFRRDNHTHFTYPHTWFHRKDYLYICKAPLIYPKQNSKPDSVSLHVCTCNEPYSWMKPTFISISALGGVGIVYVLFAFTCYCLYTKRRSLCANHHGKYCPLFKTRQKYNILSEESTTIQA